MVDADAGKALGKEFSHGWPLVAFDTVKPNYDIEDFRDRSNRESQLYIHPQEFNAAHTRQQLTQILNRDINQSFRSYRLDRWDEEQKKFLPTYDRQIITWAKGTKLDRPTMAVCHKPNWWYTECWPFSAIGVKVYWSAFVLNLLICVVLIGATGCVVEELVRLAPQIFRFRLVHLFVLVGIISAVFATVANYRKQFEIEREVAQKFNDDIGGVGYEVHQTSPKIMRPNWLTRLVGTGWDQTFLRIRHVYLQKYNYEKEQMQQIDSALNQLSKIKHLEIKSSVAGEHHQNLTILGNCETLCLIVNRWKSLPEILTAIGPKTELLKLLDTEFNQGGTYVSPDVGVDRRIAFKSLTARKTRYRVLLEGSGWLTLNELKLLDQLAPPTVRIQQCTLHSPDDFQWLDKLQLDSENSWYVDRLGFYLHPTDPDK